MSGKVICNALVTVIILPVTLSVVLAKGPKMKPVELVARHLEALGPTQARVAAQSRIAQGKGRIQVIRGGPSIVMPLNLPEATPDAGRVHAGSFGVLTGPAGFASQGEKVRLMIRFNHVDYRAEQVSFDGDKVRIPHLVAGRRSVLGEFLHQQGRLVKEGLLGGVLSTAWPLLDLQAKNPKLKYKGLKKVEGQQLLALEYRPRKSWGDVNTKLYFDPETFCHVASIYKVTIKNVGRTFQQSRQLLDTRIKMEEWFSDFQVSDDLNLPRHWMIRFTIDSSYGSYMAKWDIDYRQITHNTPIESSHFAAAR